MIKIKSSVGNRLGRVGSNANTNRFSTPIDIMALVEFGWNFSRSHNVNRSRKSLVLAYGPIRPSRFGPTAGPNANTNKKLNANKISLL